MPTLVYANIPAGHKAVVYAVRLPPSPLLAQKLTTLPQLSPRVYKTDLHVFHHNRVLKTLTKTKYDKNAAAWLCADGQEVVHLGEFPQGAQLALQMGVQKSSTGTVVTPYELDEGTLQGNTMKFGANNVYDGIGQAEMVVVQWFPINPPAPAPAPAQTMTYRSGYSGSSGYSGYAGYPGYSM
ncbi:hypothetical protein NLJ89_g325 [Agrocybe chaxingu]|uniref:Uncharacterized protein n=1 Tax=Agrocybe chaxingu TaxID=84603 RepID=A0A9W8TF23_9AGAR|nr:hypothetical protein NLJ89_g325 [Agrocybe chaxingu]